MNVSEALKILSWKAASKNPQKARLTIDGTQQRNEITLDGKVVSYQSRVISFLCLAFRYIFLRLSKKAGFAIIKQTAREGIPCRKMMII